MYVLVNNYFILLFMPPPHRVKQLPHQITTINISITSTVRKITNTVSMLTVSTDTNAGANTDGRAHTYGPTDRRTDGRGARSQEAYPSRGGPIPVLKSHLILCLVYWQRYQVKIKTVLRTIRESAYIQVLLSAGILYLQRFTNRPIWVNV